VDLDLYPNGDVSLLLHVSSHDDGHNHRAVGPTPTGAPNRKRLPNLGDGTALTQELATPMNPANASSNPLARVPKYAWGLAVVGGLIWVLLGLLILFLPGDPGNRIFFTGDPSSYSTEASNDLIYSARVVGVTFLTAGLLLSAIGLTAFKGGEKWAWYGTATPLITLLFSVYLAATGERGSAVNVFIQFLPLWVVQALALLLSIRSFFPAKPAAVIVAP